MFRAAFLAAALLAHLTAAFNFNVSSDSVNECGEALFTWEEGKAPYNITVMAELDVAVEFQIPTTDIVEQDGLLTYKYTVPFKQSRNLVFIMSDSSGYATGGASGKIPVGQRPSGASCTLTSGDALPWYFAMYPENNMLPQCGSVGFETTTGNGTDDTHYNIQYPVTVTGVIPSGQVMQWQMKSKQANFQVNIAQGTDVIFCVVDASGQEGGCSSSQTITSGVSSCINSNSPSKTPTQSLVPSKTGVSEGHNSSSSSSSTKSTGTSSPDKNSNSSTGLSTGALAGIIVAVVVGLLLLLFLILFFCCRRRIKDSIAHRRLKKDRKKNRANLDLYEDTGGMAMSNARNGGVSLRDHEGAAAISPFLAPGPDASRPSMQSDTNMYGAGGYHAPSHYSSQPNFADGAAAGAWPQAATMSSSGSSQGYHEPMYSASSSSSYHEPMYGGGARAAPTKAQLAMSNPDEVLRDPTQPQMYAPPGGFRRHEDAGSFGAPPAPEVEDLPPTYNPQWEQSSQSSRPEKGPL